MRIVLFASALVLVLVLVLAHAMRDTLRSARHTAALVSATHCGAPIGITPTRADVLAALRACE